MNRSDFPHDPKANSEVVKCACGKRSGENAIEVSDRVVVFDVREALASGKVFCAEKHSVTECVYRRPMEAMNEPS